MTIRILLLTCFLLVSEGLPARDGEEDKERLVHVRKISAPSVDHIFYQSREKRLFLGPLTEFLRIQLLPLAILPSNFILLNVQIKKKKRSGKSVLLKYKT